MFNLKSLKTSLFWQKWSLVPRLTRSLFSLSIIFIVSMTVGLTMAQAIEPSQSRSTNANLELGKETYLQNCSSCHIPIPPEVLPTATWKEILENPQQHYGKSLPDFFGLSRQLIWQYLSYSSRDLIKDEVKPSYVSDSRYFKALHPQVELPQPVTNQTCLSCHPGASKLDYRSLAP